MRNKTRFFVIRHSVSSVTEKVNVSAKANIAHAHAAKIAFHFFPIFPLIIMSIPFFQKYNIKIPKYFAFVK